MSKKDYFFCKLGILSLLIFIVFITCVKLISDKYCDVSFIMSNDVVTHSVRVTKNSIISQPPVNNINDLKFLGWYKDNIKYNFDTPITEDITLQAVWEAVDVEKPVLTLKGEKEISIIINGTYSEAGYNAYDKFDGDLSSKVIINNNINNKEIGTYKIEYEVSDQAGNKDIQSRVVNVILPNNIGRDDSIYVSIYNQKLWYYKDDKLFYTTDVVTGYKGIYDTPKGVSKIYSKRRNVDLKGYKYRVHVNYWMPITYNDGVALHDSGRSAFGGNIYTWNGSHGCINLSYNSAAYLFKYTKVGTKVYVF